MLSETRRRTGQGTWSGLLTQASPPLHSAWFDCTVRNVPTHPIPLLNRPCDLIHHLTHFEPQMQKSENVSKVMTCMQPLFWGRGGCLKSCQALMHRAHSHAVDEVEIYLAVDNYTKKLKSCLFLHVTKNTQTQGGAGKIKDVSYYLSSTSHSSQNVCFLLLLFFFCISFHAQYWHRRLNAQFKGFAVV